MVSGQWNRETVKALWQLTSRYWRSEEKKSAWMYLGSGVHDAPFERLV